MLKSPMRRLVQRFGWDLHRFSAHAEPEFQLLQGIRHCGADLIFDIGANEGQFCRELRQSGYDGSFVSFEPLSKAHTVLSDHAARDPKWRVYDRTAIGDVDGNVEINIAGNSVSSSLLPMLEAHTDAAAHSEYVGVESCPVARLDTVAPRVLSEIEHRQFLLKIDTQGFEWAVLDGAEQTLVRAAGVLCELSLVQLYDGQKLWRDVIARLEASGFTLWSVFEGFTDQETGRTLQLDGLFLKNGLPPIHPE